MTGLLALGVCGIGSYLLGSIPFGYVLSRARGVDIRTVGSGNIGATNVIRAVGRFPGTLTFLCDFLKGFVPVFLLAPAVDRLYPTGDLTLARLLSACGAVAGHNWPVFLGFRGGKGVATSFGALVAVAPLPLLMGVAAWVFVFLTSHIVSLASISAAAVMAVSGWAVCLRRSEQSLLLPVTLTLLALVAVWRHKANMQRLMRGIEPRFSFRKARGRHDDGEADEDWDHR